MDEKLLLEVDSSLDILESTEIKILAPLQLAWAMVRSLNNDILSSKNSAAGAITSKLAAIAFEAGVWRISRTILEMPQLTQNSSSRAANEAILSLVDVALNSFDAESAGTTFEIAKTIVACFKQDQVSESFWKKFDVYQTDPDESGVTGFVAHQIRLLPLDFEMTVQILAAAGSSKTGAKKVGQILNGFEYISENITGCETSEEIASIDGGSRWQSLRKRSTAKLPIAPNSVGDLYQIPHLGAIVQLGVSYSFLCLSPMY